MPRKARRQEIAPATVRGSRPEKALLGYALTGLLAAGLGSGGTYLALRPALTRAAATSAVSGQAALALGNQAFDQKNWPQAITYYTQAIAGGVDTPDIHTDLGTAYRAAGQPQKALAEYQTAQRENPNHENSLFNQGVVYAADLNQPDKALVTWQQYIQRFPNGAHTSQARQLVATILKQTAPPGPNPHKS